MGLRGRILSFADMHQCFSMILSLLYVNKIRQKEPTTLVSSWKQNRNSQLKSRKNRKKKNE